MSATNFNTKNDTFRKLMGNGLTYRVPRFQRDYSWSEEEWDDLWQDIVGTVASDGEPAHYMGYLVLQSDDDKQFDIIDGQQRLTTLSILVLAALRQLSRLIKAGVDIERTKQRLEGLRQTYIGYLDPVTLIPRSKLTLNRNNDRYYQTYLVTLDQLPVRNFKASEHLLRKASDWFERRLGDHVEKLDDKGLALAQLIDIMSDHLFFTVITVSNELNAYKVFETLNARGVRLSSTDLLKNYLFSVLDRKGQHEHQLQVLDDRWESIVGRLGPESFTDFLRVHWISRHSFVRQADLFKTIRTKIVSAEVLFELLRGLEEDMDAYLALASPDGSDWTSMAKRQAINLRMFSVRQPWPLLLAAKRNLTETDFEKLMRAIVVISFRYNVIGNLQTSEQERQYHAEAQRIANGDHKTLRVVLDGIRGLYPSDDAFRAAFAEKAIGATQPRNRRIVRYILGELERQSSGLLLDTESATLTIEHILPVSPGDGWDAFRYSETEEFANRLGNMTLLSKGSNKDVGNAAYAEKRPVFAQSEFPMTQAVARDNDDWTPERLTARQSGMAKIATAIWRIEELV